ncbi:MAG TPA: hypothetical protein PLC07_05365 [Bacillota bacterium]|nr:hypothetical protein [Bacillota bacterium]HPT86317.1 hypothetical protein [Bacillota bacterium]
MKWVLAAVAGPVIAYIWNRILRRTGLKERVRTGFLTPLGEECIKYCIAWLLHLDPFGVSALFGLGEGLYEALFINTRPGIVIFFAGIAIHTGFGAGYLITGRNGLGLSVAVMFHLIWNNVIVSGISEYNKS